jgi:iron complex outermembrane receptor protein
MRKLVASVLILLGCAGLGGTPAFAQTGNAASAEDLLNLSMEDLMKVEVSTASRHSESRKQTPAAITVLTAEDIRRSGATSLPEVLRLVRGVYVARLDANKWSVSSRGFGGRFANKMLVLVDGVSIYSPLFSGTFWEAENVMIEDIERIEVIRGPGGATWGANAVNGTINIITKPASETGNLLRAGTGTEDRARLGVRVSEQVSEDLALRVSGQYLHRGEMEFPQGGGSLDEYYGGDTQFRMDWNPNERDHLTLAAKYIHMKAHESYVLAQRFVPWSRTSHDISLLDQTNLSLQWNRQQDHGGEMTLRAYFDYWDNRSVVLDDRRYVVDVEHEWRRPVGDRVELVYGGGINHVWDDIGARYGAFFPEHTSDTTVDFFGSISYWAVPEKLRLVAGTRAEMNDYTGFEIEPTLRATWLAAENHTVWASISRAIRVPARGETDIFLPSLGFPGGYAALVGNDGMESESLIAYELGYRFTPRPTLALELELFFNHYHDLRTIELTRPYVAWQPAPMLVVPFVSRNNMEAESAGGSIFIDWRPVERWRLRAHWTYFNLTLRPQFRTLDLLTEDATNDAPRHIFTIWNSFDITPKVTLDAILQYTDRLDGLDVEDYFTANLRLGWKPREDLEIAIVGSNLLEPERLEYRSSLVNTETALIERGIYAEVSWQF